MARQFLTNVGFAVQRVTDEHSAEDLEVLKPRELGAGSFVFGFVLEGAFIPIREVKAGGVLKKIAAAKAARDASASSSSEQNTPTG